MKRLKLFTFLFALIALSLSGCDSKDEIVAAPYQVIDTGFWNEEHHNQPLWLDNDRILFASSENLKANGPGPTHLKIFNTRTGQLETSALSFALCVTNGIGIFSGVDGDTQKPTLYRGTPENYHLEPQHPDDTQLDTTFDCDWVPKQPYEIAPDGYARKFKLRGENYGEVIEPATAVYEFMKRPRDRRQEQETGNKGSVGKNLYHQNINHLNHPGTLMPPAVSGGIRYSEFLDAYVVSTNRYDPNYPETRSFSILHSNGELETIQYPKTMLPGNNDIYPVKAGFLVHYQGRIISETDSGTTGLYLITGDEIQRVIIGIFGHVVVSPDGCKAAIAHADTLQEDLFKPVSKRTIKFINFCQGDSKS